MKDRKLSASKLKRLRKSKTWTQAELSRKSGIQIQQIKKMEKGTITQPGVNIVHKLCEVFEVDLQDITIQERK